MKSKNIKGITLIALVITIIVLLVLAGATFKMISGNNGILLKVIQAKESTQQASVEERVRIAIQSALSSDYNEHGKITEVTLIQELEKEGLIENENDLEVIENSKWELTKEDKKYLIYSDGKFEEKQSTLPADYQQLEYIESTGTQYIDTGYIPTPNTKIITKIASNSFRNDANIFTAKWSTTGFAMITYGNQLRWHNDGWWNLTPSMNKNAENTIEAYKNTVKLNNSIILDEPYSNLTYSDPIKIFGYPGNTHMNKFKLYNFEIYENNTLVRKYVPAKNSSGKSGLYELKTGTFLIDVNKGNFIEGV